MESRSADKSLLESVFNILEFQKRQKQEINKSNILNECNLLYECSICLSVFRNILNFQHHKDHCQGLIKEHRKDVSAWQQLQELCSSIFLDITKESANKSDLTCNASESEPTIEIKKTEMNLNKDNSKTYEIILKPPNECNNCNNFKVHCNRCTTKYCTCYLLLHKIPRLNISKKGVNVQRPNFETHSSAKILNSNLKQINDHRKKLKVTPIKLYKCKTNIYKIQNEPKTETELAKTND